MRLEHEPPDDVKKAIIGIIGKYINLAKYKVFIFGSRVTGKGSEYSDIDVGIEGPEPVPPARMTEIRDDIEDLPFLYHIDAVDFSGVSDQFREVAMEKVEYIN